MVQRPQTAAALLLLALYATACGDTNSNSTSDSQELFVFRCGTWNTKLGQTFCDPNSELQNADAGLDCQTAIGATAFKHATRVKNDICPLMLDLLDRKSDCERVDNKCILKEANPFLRLCNSTPAVDCLHWQNNLTLALGQKSLPCTDLLKQPQQLQQACTSAIGSFVLSSNKEKRTQLCNSFAGPLQDQASFMYACQNSVLQSDLRKIVFKSFTKACLAAFGTQADQTLFWILEPAYTIAEGSEDTRLFPGRTPM